MRKKTVKPETPTLEELVSQYGATNDKAKELKTMLDGWNKQIKSIMSDKDIDTFEAGGYKASYSVRTTSSMNTDMLLSLFKSDKKLKKIAKEYGIVKTTEYIDMDALENALYHDAVADSEIEKLNTCKVEKTTEILKVTKKK